MASRTEASVDLDDPGSKVSEAQKPDDLDVGNRTVDWYSKRPSLWVEPTTAWGEGSIDLLEIPTTGETLDNIVAFWTPKKPVAAGESLNYGYKLYWSALPVMP